MPPRKQVKVRYNDDPRESHPPNINDAFTGGRTHQDGEGDISDTMLGILDGVQSTITANGDEEVDK